MPRADWIAVANEIVAQARERQRDQSVTLSLGDLFTMSGGDSEPDGYRTRSYWAQCQRGDPYWRGFRDAGLVLNFQPDQTGRDVESVTFRIDRSRD